MPKPVFPVEGVKELVHRVPVFPSIVKEGRLPLL
jgi:hypothetical protein